MGVISRDYIDNLFEIEIQSGCPSMKEAYQHLLRNCRTTVPVKLIIDNPIGYGLGIPHFENPKTAILTASHSPLYLSDLIKKGLMGVVQSPINSQDLKFALDAVARGMRYFPEINCPTLPDRLRKVLRLVASGKTCEEISNLLNLSKKTVSNIVNELTYTLGVDDKQGLIASYWGVREAA